MTLYYQYNLKIKTKMFKLRVAAVKKLKLKLWQWTIPMAGLVAIYLSGCGIQTQSERQARSDAKTLAGTYRPGDRKVTLPVLDSNATLATFLTYAMLNQPRVEAAYYEYAAQVERITLARSLPDPRLSFVMDITNVISAIVPGLMIDIPWPGKLIIGADVASAVSRVRYYDYENAVLLTAFEVKRPYYQLYFLGERIRLNRKMLNLMNEVEEIARAQYESGKVTLQDVLRTQIKQARLKNDIANLEDSRNPLMSKLKTALGMAPGQPNPPMPSRLEPTKLDMSSDQLFTIAMAQNPRLKAMEAEVRAAEEGIKLARQSQYPDFSVGVAADVKAVPMMWLPKLDVTLPVWLDKIAAEIAAAQAGKEAASAKFTAEQLKLAVEFADKSFMYREASRNLKLFDEGLLAKAHLSLYVALSAYSSGRIDFINLLEAESVLLDFQLAEVDARLQIEMALAELSLIIGLRQPGEPIPGTTAQISTEGKKSNEH
jgi:outer membrane protein TolC